MKKYLLSLFISSATLSFVAGQKIRGTDVPQPVQAAFTKAYPGLNAHWEKEKGNYEAAFTNGGKATSATFKPGGVFIESEVVILETDLPSDVLSYIKTNYKAKKINESSKITSANGVVTYEAEVDGKDVIFDSKGKFIKVVKD